MTIKTIQDVIDALKIERKYALAREELDLSYRLVTEGGADAVEITVSDFPDRPNPRRVRRSLTLAFLHEELRGFDQPGVEAMAKLIGNIVNGMTKAMREGTDAVQDQEDWVGVQDRLSESPPRVLQGAPEQGAGDQTDGGYQGQREG